MLVNTNIRAPSKIVEILLFTDGNRHHRIIRHFRSCNVVTGKHMVQSIIYVFAKSDHMQIN